jgi:hypothetical protein
MFLNPVFETGHMFTMSSNDFSVHTSDCDDVTDGIPLSDLPDEVTSVDDLTCNCWDEFDNLDQIE